MITIRYLPEAYEFSTEDGAVFAKTSEKNLRTQTVTYRINDLAYWDAMVLWSHKLQRVLAVRSHVIGLGTATKLVKQALADAIPF
jgi:hypothetical protein